jgi:uncharacterized membrane protein (Fun14 family)
MTATTLSPTAARRTAPSALRRVFGVVARPDTYLRIGYLLLGLPLGTIWFTALVTGWAVSVSMIVVALVGIPMLLMVWFATRAFANVERSTANALLGTRLPAAPLSWGGPGNPWLRLRAMTNDRGRRRELAFLLLRFPAGIATFTAAVTALSVPFLVAYAPFAARSTAEPFGTWSQSARMEDIASSGWAWLLVPAGAALLIGAIHALRAIGAACARWTTASLG